jgi:hypothetical protein
MRKTAAAHSAPGRGRAEILFLSLVYTSMHDVANACCTSKLIASANLPYPARADLKDDDAQRPGRGSPA